MTAIRHRSWTPASTAAALLLTACGLAHPPIQEQQEHSAAWRTFVEQRQHGLPTTLPDYSHAGYALAPSTADTAADLEVFDIRTFGGRADDELSDREAIEIAIRAAEAAGGGIIQFPPGRFLLSEEEGRSEGIVIRADHVVLRGAGSGPGGTELYMRHRLLPRDPSQPWSTPSLLRFQATATPEGGRTLCRVVERSRRETFVVHVDDVSQVRIGDHVMLYMRNPAATPDLLAGLEPWEIWENAREKGIRMNGERHRVAAVEDGMLTFAEPIHLDIDPTHGWTVRSCPLGTGWGVEDIAFRGDAPEPFVHHKDAAHDSGWSILQFAYGHLPYVKRCRFVDVSSAVQVAGCYGGTVINCSIEGRRGHLSISSTASYGTLIAFCVDRSTGGAFHGFGVSQSASGTVIYRSRSSERGLDWHGAGPYATLVDASSGGLLGNGGNYTNLPNHLQFLTLWNYEQTGGEVFDRLNWWEPRRGAERYSHAKVVKPVIVGFHGLPTTFREGSCSLVESLGAAVEPTSLFEAQLELRTGGLPAWVDEGRRQLRHYLEYGGWADPPSRDR